VSGKRARLRARVSELAAQPRVEQPRNPCRAGKAWYSSQERAELAITRFQTRLRERGQADERMTMLRSYYCWRCDRWHLTSQPQRSDLEAIERTAPFVLSLVFDW